jgi:riboflavin transporter FmnP
MSTNTVTNQKESLFTTKRLVLIGMFSALAYVLMLIRLPFKFLGFLEFEFSDVPAVIAALVYGPAAGIVVELIKNLIKAVTASTTNGIGELANFFICSSFMLPVGLLYKFRKGKKSTQDNAKSNKALYMIFMFTVGTIAFTISGALLNYFVMIPLYAKLFGGMDTVVGSAASMVPAIKDLSSLILLGITPFNIVKGIVISIVGYYTFLLLRGKLQ